ncbi:MAG: DUF3488 and transglutaminase-like domain-containing protein [Ruaniaceae bacterium]|nr:DUF3488 and transglutaminase-like domain-containing protein [Ruaniaceae bacterium]
MAAERGRASTQAHPGELNPVRLLTAGLALMALWALVVMTLTEVFLPGPWIPAALTICAATLLVACLLRTVRGEASTSASLAGGLAGALTWVYWVWRSGRLGAWVSEPREMLLEAQGIAYDDFAPLDPAGPLQDLALLAILLGVFATALILVGSGMPLAAGVVASAFMLVPYAVIAVRMDGTLLVLAGLALAMLAWLGSPRARWLGLGAAALAVAVAGAAMALAPPTRDRIWNESVVAAPVSTSVPDVTITLANDLRYRSNARVFDFTSDGPGPLRFTLATLSEFSGGRWLPDDEFNAAGSTVTAPRAPITIPPSSEFTIPAEATSTVAVTINGLVSEWLPLPQSATRVESADSSFDPAQWLWSESSSTARSESTTTRRSDQYTAEYVPTLPNDWTSFRDVDLGSVMTLYPEGTSAPAELEPYLALPEGLPDTISEPAQQATQGAQDRLELGSALQAWFTDGSFEYDEAAPYSPGMEGGNPYDVMEVLLADRRGFCVHYASTFAVMARYLGAPTRVAIGYASFSDGQGESTVRGRELHAWPEIFVEGIGWVPFEPTPGGAGARSAAGEPADLSEGPIDEDTPEPEEDASETPEPEEAPEVTEPDDAATPEGGTGQRERGNGALTILVLVCAALLLPAAIRRARNIRRVRAARGGLLPARNAWAEFGDCVIDLGLTARADGATPRADA